MKYPDGTDIRVGDKVKVANDDSGIVVLSIDTNAYSTEFPAKEWSYLKNRRYTRPYASESAGRSIQRFMPSV